MSPHNGCHHAAAMSQEQATPTTAVSHCSQGGYGVLGGCSRGQKDDRESGWGEKANGRGLNNGIHHLGPRYVFPFLFVFYSLTIHFFHQVYYKSPLPQMRDGGDANNKWQHDNTCTHCCEPLLTRWISGCQLPHHYLMVMTQWLQWWPGWDIACCPWWLNLALVITTTPSLTPNVSKGVCLVLLGWDIVCHPNDLIWHWSSPPPPPSLQTWVQGSGILFLSTLTAATPSFTPNPSTCPKQYTSIQHVTWTGGRWHCVVGCGWWLVRTG